MMAWADGLRPLYHRPPVVSMTIARRRRRVAVRAVWRAVLIDPGSGKRILSAFPVGSPWGRCLAAMPVFGRSLFRAAMANANL